MSRRLALARKALRTLHEVLREPKTAIVRDAAIQRFEYSLEAGWKAGQSYCRLREGVDVRSPAGAIRSAHALGLLDEPAARIGLEMVGDRNLTVHTYNEALAERIYARLPEYARVLEAWLTAMEAAPQPPR